MDIKGEIDEKGVRWIKLFGGHGDSEGEIKFKAERRTALAMRLLGLYGERVSVSIRPPLKPKQATAKKAKKT